MPCGTRVTEARVLGLEQHGGQSYGLLPPPGGYVIILVCMYVCVCVCVCVYVCLSVHVNTITQKIINIWRPNFAHTFAIA